ncbi:MAG TPA: phosphate ABC transporter permease subunit PstC [Verrucomicrobiae bacterium]|jgi:phosphate transport system permease protein
MNTAEASVTKATSGVSRRGAGTSRFADRAFEWLTLVMAFSIFLFIALIGVELFRGAAPALRKFGWHFLTGSNWDPVNDVFGALPFIFGTLVSSAIALLIAVPLSIATAVYLTELAPLWLRQPLVVFIELLAAIPSVILGFWGFYVMVPWLHLHVYPALRSGLGILPIFQGPDNGPCILSAGIVLAIMIIPIVTSVSREILRSVPGLQREAAYALGATRWEVTRIAVLSYAKRGLFGAVILGLGRALGETMAVTMLIGNAPYIGTSVFAAGQTLASVIANEFTEATDNLYSSALFEIGLVLLGVTLVVNALARLLLITFAGPSVKPQH